MINYREAQCVETSQSPFPVKPIVAQCAHEQSVHNGRVKVKQSSFTLPNDDLTTGTDECPTSQQQCTISNTWYDLLSHADQPAIQWQIYYA